MTDFKYKVGDRVRLSDRGRNLFQDIEFHGIGTVTKVYEPFTSRHPVSSRWPYTVTWKMPEANGLFAEDELEAANA